MLQQSMSIPKVRQIVLTLMKAIAQGGKYNIDTLDNRAAAYTKLGNLQAALRDGKLMIQEEKINCLVKPSDSVHGTGD